MSSDRAAAEALLAQAGEFEAAGKMTDAVRCYRRAFKLCPELQHSDDTVAAAEDPAMEYARLPPPHSGFRTFHASTLTDPDARADMLAFFDSEGYLVVDGAVSDADLATAEGHFERFMAAAEIDVTSATSLEQHFADPGVGIVSKRSAGQSAMNWHVRSRPAVKDVFRLVHGMGQDEKLITSFDGFNYFRNPEVNPAWLGTTRSWFHFDGGAREHARYIQGIVNLRDCVDENDAGLVLLPRSHRTVWPLLVPEETGPHPSFITYMGPHEWAKVRAAGVQERPFRVPLKAGTIVVWRSSVLHCNSACLPRPTATPEQTVDMEGESGLSSHDAVQPKLADPSQLLRRLACYICMGPDPADPELTKKRLEFFTEGRTAGHQPDVLRGAGDYAADEFVASGAVIVDPAKLPDGAAELL